VRTGAHSLNYFYFDLKNINLDAIYSDSLKKFGEIAAQRRKLQAYILLDPGRNFHKNLEKLLSIHIKLSLLMLTTNWRRKI